MDARLVSGALPVAAAGHLRGLLLGPSRPVRVLTSGRLAAYLAVDAAEPRVVAVVAPGAVVPAGSLVLPRGARPDVVLPDGSRLVLGGGRLTSDLGDHVLRVARWFDADSIPHGRPDPNATRLLAARVTARPSPPPEVESARSGAVDAARALAEGRDAEATHLLVSRLGLGPGATPSGDDVAAGVLLAALALAPGEPARTRVEAVARAVADGAAGCTTAVSTALLADVAEGRCPRPVALALAVLAPAAGPPSTDPGDVARRLDGLLDLGHHSGADLATGLLAVLTTALDGATPQHVPSPRSHTTTRRIA